MKQIYYNLTYHAATGLSTHLTASDWASVNRRTEFSHYKCRDKYKAPSQHTFLDGSTG